MEKNILAAVIIVSIVADKPGWFANGDFNQFIREER